MESITKDQVRALIKTGNQSALLERFDEDPPRVRRYLKRLCCAPDDPIHDVAIASFRMLSSKRATHMPQFFLETMRRCLWEMNEEGGNIAWSAPEIIGAVVAGSPEQFRLFASYLIMAAMDEPTFHPSLLAAVDMLAEVNEEMVHEFRPALNALKRRSEE